MEAELESMEVSTSLIRLSNIKNLVHLKTTSILKLESQKNENNIYGDIRKNTG